MKRFAFRLDSILRLRVHEFEAAQRRFQVLDHQRRAQAARLGELNQHLATGQRLLTEDVARGCDARQIGLRARGLAVGRFQVAQAEVQLEALHSPWEAARQQMLAARVKKRSLEQLRDRQAAEHQAEAARAEQAALDEMSVLRAARASADGHKEASWVG